MIFKGFKFGMILQLAVGPMCLMVFHTSSAYGLLYGLYLMLAIALVDVIYIALSCAGAAAVVNRAGVKAVIKVLGCLVLVLFGANTIASVFNFSFLPRIALFSSISGKNIFVQGLLLTASNPLTIVFWSGVFSTQIIENGWSKKQVFAFAAGCVLSTVIFLGLIALLGSLLSGFLPQAVIQILNVAVGAFLIFFGLRLLFKKDQKTGGKRDLPAA